MLQECTQVGRWDLLRRLRLVLHLVEEEPEVVVAVVLAVAVVVVVAATVMGEGKADSTAMIVVIIKAVECQAEEGPMEVITTQMIIRYEIRHEIILKPFCQTVYILCSGINACMFISATKLFSFLGLQC